MKLPGKVPAIKTDSRFIKDVTVPDGTPMAPSTPFTKIWRMRNNGFSKWPYGTQLLWVGGDRLTRLSPFRLAVCTTGIFSHELIINIVECRMEPLFAMY
jgi:next-to-BRCA1 protein 1